MFTLYFYADIIYNNLIYVLSQYTKIVRMSHRILCKMS